MKKTRFFLMYLVIISFGFTSCEKDDSKVANVSFSLNQTSFDNLNYAEPIRISGTVTADKAITALTFTGVKQEGGVYVAVGDPQNYVLNGLNTINFEMDYFVDAKNTTSIEVKVNVGEASKSAYITVASVTGEPKGSAFLGEVLMKADSIVWNAENHPDIYTTPNTGAATNIPSYFSIHGVEIDGQVKHVLSLDELRSVDGRNGSFCFINCLQNTSNNAYISSQRGYMFSNAMPSQLRGGTTGRQCDIYEIGGHAIRPENTDTTAFVIIAGSWIGANWKEDRYKFVDSLFVALGNTAETPGAKAKANYLLGQIQKRLDSSTLGEEVNPTSLSALFYARRRTNAGTGGTTVMAENFRPGDYIILKNVKGNKLYYGIMQISQMYDDSQAFVNVDGVGQKIGQEEAKMLFHKPLILNVKVQTQL